jgi:hypothetical protein
MNFIQSQIKLVNSQNNLDTQQKNSNKINTNKNTDKNNNNHPINSQTNKNPFINNFHNNANNQIKNILANNNINNSNLKSNINPSSKNLMDTIKDNYSKNKSELNKIEEKMLYGRNKGCNFVNLYCHDENGDLFEEYCDPVKDENKQKCNFHYEAISHCRLLEKEAGTRCAYWFPLEGGNCKNLKENRINGNSFLKYGPQSKCFDVAFDSKKEDAVCLEAFCDNWEKAIYVFLEGNRFKSPYENDKPKIQYFYSGKHRMMVLFPKSFERFCFLENNAKNPDKGFKK